MSGGQFLLKWGRLDPEQPTPQIAHDADFTLVSEDLKTDHTNATATGLITGTLSPAEVGNSFSASRQADKPFRLKPFGAEKFIGGDPGGYLEILDYGDVAGYCYQAGQWTIYADGTLYTLEVL